MHQLQVIDEPLPHDEHDFTLDFIVTPEELISCGPAYYPRGLVWRNLAEEQIAAIPVLAAMARERADLTMRRTSNRWNEDQTEPASPTVDELTALVDRRLAVPDRVTERSVDNCW